ncbi:MAG TPA: phospholipid carrier-dependent glycosyltransferase [Candidatus Acidoferrum sp.]|nr:phospholipid carrier-dependent glycosyltransferase [Candidatus Acidoferrum sp.]
MINSWAVLNPKLKSREQSAWPAVCIAAAVGICLFGQLGAVGLTGPDEPRYVWIARAMAQTGDWVTPRLYGAPWFEKPVLYYWAAAIGFRLNFSAEWAARLPSAFGALVTAIAIAWLARRIYGGREDWSRDPAHLVPLIFATSVAATGFARGATPDMLFSACIALAMLCAACLLGDQGAIRTAQNQTPKSSTNRTAKLSIFGAVLGAGTLAKGPAAVILAAGALVLWALLAKRWRTVLRLAHPTAIASFCVVAVPWYAVCAARNPDFLRVFILQHNFQRYLTPIFEHKQPFWFFGPIFLVALLPWTILLWPAAQRGLRLWRERSWHDSPGLFFACWTIFPILFFSASQSKLPSYILPSIAPAAIVCAMAGVRVLQDGSKAAWPVAVGLLTTWFALAVGAFIFIRGIDWLSANPDAFSNGAPQSIYAGPVLLAIAALAIGTAGFLGNARWMFGLCALCFVASVEFANLVILPHVEGRYSARPFVQLVSNDAHATRVFEYQLPRAWTYGLHYYAEREIPEWSPADPAPALVLTTPQGLAQIRQMGRSSGSLGETRGGKQPVIYVPVNAAPRVTQ